MAQLPITYLGVPLHNRKLAPSDWGQVLDKIQNKLQNWKSSLLSLGGRITLVNSVISAMPLYNMSIYKLPEKVRKKIDSIRCQFFWQGTTSRKKYALVSWKKLCNKKEMDGMGILDLKVMNIALLLKWWWRYNNNQEKYLWKSMIKQKYKTSHAKSKYSHFWKKVIKLEHLGATSVSYTVGNGADIQFWHSNWFNDCSLATQFPFLYNISANKQASVQETVLKQGENLRFTRELVGMLWTDWINLHNVIRNTHLSFDEDRINWRWDSSGKFSTQTCYNFLKFGGIQVLHSDCWWTLKIPHKVQAFMWLLHHNKILTKENLLKRGWQGTDKCCFCAHFENTNHLFLLCPFVQQVWFWMGHSQNFFHLWTDIQDVLNFSMQLQNDNRTAFLITFSAFCWGIWNVRNGIIFNNDRLRSVRCILKLICGFLQLWSGVIAEKVQEQMLNWRPLDWDIIPLQAVMPAGLMIEGLA